MRYLAIPMIMTALMLGGCLSSVGSFAADVGKNIGIDAAKGLCRGCGKDIPILGARWRRQNWYNSDDKHPGNHSHKNLRPQYAELCEKSDNPAACYHRERYKAPWEGLSDAEFCKRYSPVNKAVALEMARRKMDASKC